MREEERNGLGVIFTAKSGDSPEPTSEIMLAQKTPAPEPAITQEPLKTGNQSHLDKLVARRASLTPAW